MSAGSPLEELPYVLHQFMHLRAIVAPVPPRAALSLQSDLHRLQQPHISFYPRELAGEETQTDELADVGRATYESHADMN